MKRKNTLQFVVAIALCAASAQIPAQAQGVFDMGALTNTMAQGAIVKSERERAARMRGYKNSGRRYKSHSSGKSRRPTLSKPTLGTFKPSAAVRRRAIANYVTKVRLSDPKGADSIQKAFKTQDVFGIVGRKMASYGLKTNNISDPMAVYMTVAWLGVRGRNNDPTKAQILGVRDQMARALTDTPAIKSLSDAQKQELADSFLIQAVIIDGSISLAQKQPSLMPQTKAAIAVGARKSFGFDLTTLNLTNNGLEMKL